MTRKALVGWSAAVVDIRDCPAEKLAEIARHVRRAPTYRNAALRAYRGAILMAAEALEGRAASARGAYTMVAR